MTFTPGIKYRWPFQKGHKSGYGGLESGGGGGGGRCMASKKARVREDRWRRCFLLDKEKQGLPSIQKY